MDGIKQFYHFRFADGDVVGMYHLATDDKPVKMFKILSTTNADGRPNVMSLKENYHFKWSIKFL